MRKYDKKNKRNIGILLAISFIIVVIFSYFIFRVVSTSKIEYKVLAGSILYDSDKNIMELDSDSSIKVKWSSKYYLIYNDSNYLLGENPIVYTPSNGNISLYGKFYDIKGDATVEIVDKETKLESSVVSHFYKIADRKYLLVSSSIHTEDQILNTSNYLLVELDKSGNATLTNNEVNSKTFSETIIITNDYTFDVANEILVYGENKIDLKKIIGSSNEYSPSDLLVDEDLDGDNTNISNDNEENGNGTGSGTGTSGNNTINNSNSTTYNSNTNGGDNSNNTNVTDTIEVSKRTSVIRVVPSITSLSVDYVVYDPNDEYKSIYMEIINERSSTSTIVYLNKKNTNISISDLSPNTSYKLYFYYTYYDESGSLKKYNYNTMEITTKVPVISLSLSEITGNSIGYRIDLDDKYNIDSATIELILGNEVISTYTNKSLGYVSTISDSIDISRYDLSSGIITIKLTNIVFEGNSYDTDVYYKFSYKG